MEMFDFRCLRFLWLLYIMLLAFGNPIPNPVPQTRDPRPEVPPPPANACPIEDPPIIVEREDEEFAIDVAVEEDPRNPGALQGYFQVVVNPLRTHVRSNGAEIFHQGRNQRHSPAYTPYI
ncbi:hypothetical protein FKW77_006490 [Venturia effusa]|uniref:Uncharacterized protein n=1 Tax=Venturia effusa TaxID=50376 RepID=A0A517L9H3_9PEZI|nr:hypothetical protein FKW77_006490 [Venturia effusa]